MFNKMRGWPSKIIATTIIFSEESFRRLTMIIVTE